MLKPNNRQSTDKKPGHIWWVLIGLCVLLGNSVTWGLESDELSTVLSILHQTRAVTETIRDEPWRAVALNSLALRYALAEDSDRAIKIAGIIRDEKERESTIKSIGRTLANQNQLHKVRELANSLHSQKHREAMYLYIVGAQAKAGAMAAAIEMTNNIEDLSQKERAFKAIVLAQTKAGAIDDALSTIQRMRPKWQAFALEDMALALLEQGHRKMACQIVSSIKDAYDRSQAIYALAKAFITNGDIQEAFRMVPHISRQKKRNQVLRAIAREQTQRNDLPAALKTAARIKGIAEYEETLAGIVHVLAQTGKIEEGLELAMSIKKRLFREEAFEGIIYGYARQGKIGIALKNLKTFGFTSYAQKRLLPQIAMTAARAGHIQKALNITHDLQPGFGRNDNLMNIAYLQAEKGDSTGAQKTISQMIPSEDPEMDALVKAAAIQFLSSAQTKNGGAKEAMTWINQQSNTLEKVMGLLGIVDGLLLRETQHETS